MSEADTCRQYVLPKLYDAGWNDDQIREQVTFTDGASSWRGTGPCGKSRNAPTTSGTLAVHHA